LLLHCANFKNLLLTCVPVSDGLSAAGVTAGWSGRTTCSGTGGTSTEPTNGTAAGSAPEACAAGGLHAPATARRQKSYDELDPTAMASARAQKGNQLGQIQQVRSSLTFA